MLWKREIFNTKLFYHRGVQGSKLVDAFGHHPHPKLPNDTILASIWCGTFFLGSKSGRSPVLEVTKS